MNVELQVDDLCWYAVRTHARQEARAEDNLKAWGVETFAPRLMEKRYSNGHLVNSIKPLFPRYIFARFNVNDSLRKISFTRGVEYVVNFGGWPTPVDGQIVDLIKMQLGDDGCVRIGEQLVAGDIVLIKSGPLKNFMGVFERELKNTDRVMLLLDTISYQNHIVVERHNVQKVGATGSAL